LKASSRAPNLLVVARRELVRNGRRWQTWALRSGFAAALFLLVAILWADRIPSLEAVDRVALGTTGRMLFRSFVSLQMVGLVLLTPILVANAVIEERDGGTLELLAMTRLTPADILLGKVLSRVLLLELVVLGGLPFLAVCSSLGGFGPLDLVNVFLQCTTIIVSLSAVSAFLGLYADGPFRPAIQTWFWTLGAWWMGTAPQIAMTLSGKQAATVSPPVAMYSADGWQMFGPAIVQLPVSAAVFAFAAVGLRAMLAGADDGRDGFGSLSREFDGLQTVRKSLWWTFAAIVAWLPFVVFQKPLGGWVAPLGYLSLPWTSLWIWLGTGLYLLTVRWALLRRAAKKRRTPLKSWKALSQEWEGTSTKTPSSWKPIAGAPKPAAPRRPVPRTAGVGDAEADAWGPSPGSEEVLDERRPERRPAHVVAAQVSSLSGRAARESEGVARSRRWFFAREVWADPVLWRETMTAAYGGLGTSLTRLYLGFGVIGLGLFLVGGFRHPELAMTGAVCSLVFATFTTLLTASASIAGELKHDTLGLLLSSRLSPRRILWSKVLATAAFVGPAWLGAAMLGLQGVAVIGFETVEVNQALMFGRWLGFCGWSFALLIALTISCHSIGLRVKTSSRVWIWTILWAGWNVAGPLILLFLVDGFDPAEAAVGVWNPLLAEDTWDPEAAPYSLAASALAWSAVAATLFWSNVRRVNR
jgi:ABC-type transport system involved in multi-copper enzyme maturation permease subunit